MAITPGSTGGNLGNTPIETVGSAAFNAAVNAIQDEYGSAKASDFRTWLTAAVEQDPSITPDQAITAWVTGTAISGGIQQASTIPVSTVEAAAQGAEKSLALTNPLAAIAEFFSALGQANTWIRVVKVLAGGILLVSGIVHLTGIDKNALGVAGKAVIPA